MRYFIIILYLLLVVNLRSYSKTCICQIKFQNEISEYIKLGYYYGDEMLLLDSAKTNSRGEIIYHIEECRNGLYYLALNKCQVFEFMIDECDSLGLLFYDSTNLWNVSINNCESSKKYLEYLQISDEYERKKLKLFGKEPGYRENDSIIDYSGLYNEMNNQFRLQVSGLMNRCSGSLLYSYIKANTPVKIPGLRSVHKDSLWYDNILYFQEHYFDNIDFTEHGLIYTPLLTERITHYLLHVIRQEPDEIKKGLQILMQASGKDSIMHQFVLDQVFHLYVNKRNEDPVYEYIYVGFLLKYYLINKTDIDPILKALLKEDLKKKIPLLYRNEFPGEKIYTENGSLFPLHSVKTDHTIVVYAEPGNNACEEVLMQLQNLIRTYNYLSLHVLVLNTGINEVTYENMFGSENDRWTSLYTATKEELYNLYDLKSFPVIFILDSGKKIINKNITVQQLEKYLLDIGLK